MTQSMKEIIVDILDQHAAYNSWEEVADKILAELPIAELEAQQAVLVDAASTLLRAEHKYSQAYERGTWSGKFKVELSDAERRGIAYKYGEAKAAMEAALAAVKPAGQEGGAR